MKSLHCTNLLIDAISMGICIIDKDYQVLYWNEYLEDYLNIPQQEILQKKLGDFFPEFENPKYKEMIDSIFMGWPPLFLSSRLHAMFAREIKAIEVLYQDVTISSLLDESSDNFLAVISVKDVTESNLKLEERNQLYKQAQTEIAQRQEIQEKLEKSDAKYRELNDTKDKLISIISHDLRSPLSMLVAYFELFNKSIDTVSVEERDQMLEIMTQATKTTYSLVENLLTWIRSHTAGVKYNPFNIALSELIHHAIESLNHVALKKEIHLEVECPKNINVFADRDLTHTILRNLIANALKYSFKKSTVKIIAQIEDSMVGIRIVDAGTGIDDGIKKKLFKVGETRSVPGTNQETGTGFGLVLCKEFVEKQGGEISVESEHGKGSTFRCTLPLPKE